MSDLLELVLDAHGGLANWRKVETIVLSLSLKGRLLKVKQQPQGLRGAMVQISTERPRTVISPFPHPGARGVFENHAVAIQTDAGEITRTLDRPREPSLGMSGRRRGRNSSSSILSATRSGTTLPRPSCWPRTAFP